MFRAPIPAAASTAAFGTWVRVLGYACEQECGGIIRGAAKWSDRQWIAACNVTAQDIRDAPGVLSVSGDDVVVWGYPTLREASVAAARLEGVAGGRVKSEAKAHAARMNGRLGGRPRHDGGNPEKPNTNPTEPTGTQRAEPNCGETERARPGPNPREEKDKERCVCETDTHTVQKEAEESPAETWDTWCDRLRREWPHVALERELERAQKYVRDKRGPDALLARPFFEAYWLPRCETSSSATECRKREGTEPEIAGWQAVVAESIWGSGKANEAKTWADLPPVVRDFVREQRGAVPST